jgi:hypothetical protein
MLDAMDGRRPSEEIVLDFPRGRDHVVDATRFRSTWLASSIASLRERGLGERYERALPEAHKASVLGAIAGLWLPMDLAAVHFEACDRLELSQAELLDLGMGAMKRAHKTTLSLAVLLARGAGSTPWTIFRQADRFWDRTCQGGAIGVFKLGPKEARIEEIGFPLARYRYNRITMRGILTAVAGLFCEKVYVHEIGALCTPTTLGYRVSWV